MIRLVPVLFIVVFAASPAAAQSFDCAKAQTRVEKMVCADRAIADLDEYLGRYYAGARAEISGAAGQLFFEPSRCLFLHRLPAAQSKPVVQDAEQHLVHALQPA